MCASRWDVTPRNTYVLLRNYLNLIKFLFPSLQKYNTRKWSNSEREEGWGSYYSHAPLKDKLRSEKCIIKQLHQGALTQP